MSATEKGAYKHSLRQSWCDTEDEKRLAGNIGGEASGRGALQMVTVVVCIRRVID